ncbi:MAG: hypothetical protein ACW96N_08050 [Candidatus Thorarchaeota archaeon]
MEKFPFFQKNLFNLIQAWILMKDEKLIAALRVQSVALAEIRETFRKKGLVEIMPVILSTTSDPLGPDPGSSIIGKPLIEYQGQSLVLTQSMILHSK